MSGMARSSSGCAEPDINPDGDSVNHDQAIFDAICAATSHSMFLAAGAITIDTQKFIETFNKHRDRGLCTSLSVAQRQPEPRKALDEFKEFLSDLADLNVDEPTQIALLAAREYIAEDNNPKSNRVLALIRDALNPDGASSLPSTTRASATEILGDPLGGVSIPSTHETGGA